MAAISPTLVPWRVDGPTTLHGYDDDLVYKVVCMDIDDPELQRQVALVSTWDLEGERYARMIAAVPKLLAACRAVLDRWEQGDLAGAARMCQDALQTADPDVPVAQGQRPVQPRKTRRVEYYRLWGGDLAHGTWDTNFIDITTNTPDDMLDEAIRTAARRIAWRDEPPVIVGCYCDAGDQEDNDDSPDTEVPPATTHDAREPAARDLLTKAEAAGLKAEDFDETVHELANSIAADINNAGVPDQLRYLFQEWGHEAAAREIDRLAAEKARPAAADAQSQP